MAAPSLRALAAELQVSHATVSEALRGSPRVKEATRLRIVAAAERLGYRRNPLASALMTEMRRSRNGTFRGTLSVLDPETAPHRSPAFERYQSDLLAGAAERAGELGFQIDETSVRQRGFSVEKLPAILAARGIRGVFILPACAPLNLGGIDWSDLCGLRADCTDDTPNLPSVGPDHARAVGLALDELHALGYSRPGLVLEPSLGAHHQHAWIAAFHAYFLRHRSASRGTPQTTPLIAAPLDADALEAWLTAGGYDAVLAHDPAQLDTLRAIRPEAPVTPGFCCLNLAPGAPPCAGLELRARAIGRRGIELLVERVLRHEPDRAHDIPVASLLPAAWVPSEKLRARRRPLCA